MTFLDVLRHLLRPPAPDAVNKLIDEMEAGGLVTRPIAVVCFLRGTVGSLPRRWQQGILTLDGHTLSWTRYFAVRRDRTRLPSGLDVEQVRAVTGTERLHIKEELFRIIVCYTGPGRVDLGVPTIDVPLVRRAIQRDKQALNP
ncbi:MULTISPECIES: hypothetical protein [Pseudofrankia]|uniref:hypothetical protein n=1 Tax=Pseudofrankia TaxID=2994363 RepID=UPI000234C4F2|nr:MULTISPECIES: hypothetical protein [Pseudofrankia]